MTQTILGLFALVTPVVLGTWLGTTNQRATSAFLVGWLATPFAAFFVALVLLAVWNNPNRGLLLIELPTLGIGTGLVSGAIAAVIVHRRGREMKPAVSEEQP